MPQLVGRIRIESQQATGKKLIYLNLNTGLYMCLVSVKEDISFLAAKNLHFVLTKLFISPINFQTYMLSVVEELL